MLNLICGYSGALAAVCGALPLSIAFLDAFTIFAATVVDGI